MTPAARASSDGPFTARTETGPEGPVPIHPSACDQRCATFSTFGVTKWDELPETARQYLTRLSEVAGAPIALVSTGPDREHTIVLRHPYTR